MCLVETSKFLEMALWFHQLSSLALVAYSTKVYSIIYNGLVTLQKYFKGTSVTLKKWVNANSFSSSVLCCFLFRILLQSFPWKRSYRVGKERHSDERVSQPNCTDGVWQGSYFKLTVIWGSLVDLGYSHYLQVWILFSRWKLTTFVYVSIWLFKISHLVKLPWDKIQNPSVN